MTIINLTEHVITEVTTGTSFPPSGIVARVTCEPVQIEELNGLAIYQNTYGDVTHLPPQIPNVYYIVSGKVLEASNRSDLLAPGELVRNSDGQPIGCKGFRKI